MSLFQERQASAKKVIALQNEIINLKMQLSNSKNSSSEDCKDCDAHLKEINELKELLDFYSEEIKSLKSDLKKSRSEATRLSNKLSSLESDNV